MRLHRKPREEVKTLFRFDGLMRDLGAVRREITRQCFEGEKPARRLLQSLEETLEAVEAIPRVGERGALLTDEGGEVLLDLGYEAGELRKDLSFLSEGEAMFISRLGAAHRDFGKELAEGVDFLRGVRFSILITDRDGTVNCYGGRYASSLQAVYSALFLARFAKRLAANPVLLSSGPLGCKACGN